MTDLEIFQRLMAWIASELARRGETGPLLITRVFAPGEMAEMEF